jgi:hypothetical protein
MEYNSVFVNSHEFQFTLTATSTGGWTMSVLHIDRSGAMPIELHSAIEIEFSSKSEAMRYAERVAAEMAKRRGAGPVTPVA